ncbi:hypothetical protein HBA55_15700 [Pseudomaricurvus alkylphenolicus]|jgi:5,10-methylenetetrahydrofolate reductase|uniref:methylenetetrahydrofolate reductase n=1 Tax=Pseudomaricurvus alkylphenolicus TaxID=1306991 RepID=UPI0014233223|nr:methylenetetrahydrofolate reductase [Pseudomaricurvus alkylphenolicus]NIB41048.1 hypothetical protein [Pseudomaricurvus alkylphenolicus]
MPQLLLEMVPPTRNEGVAGLEQKLAYIQEVASASPLEAVNIPEIHPESSHDKGAVRQNRFEDRMEPRQFARHIRETCGLECIVNHVVVHTPELQFKDWLRQTREEFGIGQVVFVGGEHHDVSYPGPDVCKANQIARELLPELRIGNICIPSRKDEARRVKQKCHSDVDFFTTQIIYEFEGLWAFFENLQSAGSISQTFYISFCPLSSERNLEFLRWLGVVFSPQLSERLQADTGKMQQRSCEQILAIWQQLKGHLEQSELDLCINLCPIGKVSSALCRQLAFQLLKEYEASDSV